MGIHISSGGGASKTFRKLIIFIDGSNLLSSIACFEKTTQKNYKINFQTLRDILIDLSSPGWQIGLEHIKTYFFGPKGIPEDMKSSNGNSSFSQQIDEFKNDLKDNHVRLILKEKIGNKEKGIDVALVTEFLSLAYSNAYDYALLVSGDADFISAIDEVKRLGKIVCMASFKSHFNQKLMEHIDKIIYLDEHINFLEELKR